MPVAGIKKTRKRRACVIRDRGEEVVEGQREGKREGGGW